MMTLDEDGESLSYMSLLQPRVQLESPDNVNQRHDEIR